MRRLEKQQGEPTRIAALREAARLTDGQRDRQYGSPQENFDRIAKIWTILFHREFSTEDVAIAFAAVKLARFAADSGFQPDTWIDLAGYAACGYEVGENLHFNRGGEAVEDGGESGKQAEGGGKAPEAGL
jgi:hypothetical protein